MAQPLIRKLMATGVPTLLASGLLYLQPILGQRFLSSAEYATWALGATILTTGLTLDFGGSAYVSATAARGQLTRKLFAAATLLSCSGGAIVGIAAIAVWPQYQKAHDLALPGISGMSYFGLILSAATLRSITTIYTALLMGRNQNAQRAKFLLLQAMLQTCAIISFLLIDLGLWALPLSSILASIPFATLPLKKSLFEKPQGYVSDTPSIKLANFAKWKIIASVLSLTVTQMDRWIVGSVVTATKLAQYDLASRFAGLPRLIVIGVAGVLVSEASTLRHSPRKLQDLYRRSLVIMAAILFASSLGTIAVVALYSKGIPNWPSGLFTLLLVAFGAHALTAPGTMIMGGIGRPSYDLIQILPTVTISTALWATAHATANDTLAMIASAVGLLAWCPLFIPFAYARLARASGPLHG